MRAKFFKRLLSFMIDANLIFGVIYVLFLILARSIIQSGTPDYEEHLRLYNIELAETETLLDEIDASLENEEITEDEHLELFNQYTEEFNTEVEEYVLTQFLYIINVSLYFFVSFVVLNYVYNLILQGNTFGRRFMKLRLEGNIKWYSLLTRELIYKGLFGLLTLPIDMYLIMFSKSKKAIRDRISEIYVVDESVRYPF